MYGFVKGRVVFIDVELDQEVMDLQTDGGESLLSSNLTL